MVPESIYHLIMHKKNTMAVVHMLRLQFVCPLICPSLPRFWPSHVTEPATEQHWLESIGHTGGIATGACIVVF